MKAEQGSGFDDMTGWNLDGASLQKLKEIRPLWESRPEGERTSWLELLASVLFLKRSYDGRSKDAAGLRVILERNEKNFSEDDIRHPLKELVRHGLLPGTAS